MKILITGGAGFIGSNLADRLLARGDEVLIIDDLTTGQLRNVPKGAKYYNLTIGQEPYSPESDVWLAPDWKGVDVVVHAAASYGDPNDWKRDITTNVLGTAQVVQAMQGNGIKRLIYLQTALCYGLKPLEQPITLEHPLRPWGSSYAISKTAGESYIRSAGIDFVSFRLANCYGPRNLSGPVPTFYKRLMDNNPCTVMDTRRDMVFIDDLLDVLIKAIKGQGHGFYHVSSGSDVRIADLYYAICDTLGLDRPIKVKRRTKDDVETILLDPSETEAIFRWKAQTPMTDGIKETIAYYQEFGVGATYTHLRLDENARKAK